MITDRFLCFLVILSVVDCSTNEGLQTKVGPQPIWNSTFTEKLRRDLLLNYDKFARPTQHNYVTTVLLGMSINHIEINEFKSTLIVYSHLKLTWMDEKLKWDPLKYGGIQSVHFADQELWQPDIYLYNSATSTAISHFNTNYIVYPDGTVLWVPTAQYSPLCDLNLKYWPFDSHECIMKFGSWTYNSEQIDLNIYNHNNESALKLELIVKNNEWKIRKSSISRNITFYPCCVEPYPDITITLVLDRISPSYKAIIVTPAIVIISLILLNFWLPPNAGEKIIINGCTAIIICLFLLYFTQKMPAMSDHTPLIVVFYSSCLYIVIFSMIGSVVVITLSRSKHTKPLPKIIKQQLVGKLGRYLGLTSFIQQSTTAVHKATAEEMNDHQVTDIADMHVGNEQGIVKSHPIEKPSMQEDWVLFAAAIDKISFVFFCCLFVILAIVYSV